ncbi:MAG: glycosyltransferase family 2 protein [Pirellulales bacterium]
MHLPVQDVMPSPAARQAARVSIVVPLFNEEQVVERVVERLLGLGIPECEFLLVDDGSRDGTWACIQQLAREHEPLIGIRLSRNFGQQAALLCGYRAAAGEAVICLDADLQDPPEVIPRMLAAWQAGADVVVAVRAARDGDSIFKRATAWLYYRLLAQLSDRPSAVDAGDFRLLSRRALEALLALEGSEALLRGAVGWTGFPTTTIEYERAPRAAGRTKYRLRDMLRLAREGIFATERGPVVLGHTAAALGLAAAALSAGLGAAWLAAFSLALPLLVYLAIAVEYSALIARRSLRRPAYLVREIVGKRHDA